MRKEILFGGFGGQGIVLASVVVARAASLYMGLHATQAQAYGAQARGGASKGEVVISDEPIDYPRTTNPDCLVLLSQEAYNTYMPYLREGGIAIIDVDLVPNRNKDLEKSKGAKVIEIPLTRITEDNFNTRMPMNMVAIGVLIGVTGCITLEAAEKAIKDVVPKSTVDMNLRALHLGVELSEKFVRNK